MNPYADMLLSRLKADPCSGRTILAFASIRISQRQSEEE
jgi:hypothetical protein